LKCHCQKRNLPDNPPLICDWIDTSGVFDAHTEKRCGEADRFEEHRGRFPVVHVTLWWPDETLQIFDARVI
jgi:hypothetical protein